MKTISEGLRVQELVETSLAAWKNAPAELPDLGRRYSAQEQQARERIADACLERVDRAMRDLRRRKLLPEEAQARITGATVELTSCALDLQDPYVDWLLADGFGGVSTGLAREARQMDPHVSMIDILQAARNAWTTCGLQAVFGCPVRLTPSIFAYSMLYPYSDNYLDDTSIAPEAKIAFSARFRRRLAGQPARAASQREEIIWALVKMIEAEYPRANYPQVYESLLAIHQAQEESLKQLDRGIEECDFVLPLTFTKGGTSVLADACLATGHLSPEQASFAFRWGVVLQLGDDLQDVSSDLQRSSLTIYTQRAGLEPLDEITTRTLQFGRSVLAEMSTVPTAPPVLSELLKRSSQLLLIRSAAGAPEMYSPKYLDTLEAYSPFRFEFFMAREEELARRKREYALLFEELIRFRTIETKAPLRTIRKGNVLTRQ